MSDIHTGTPPNMCWRYGCTEPVENGSVSMCRAHLAEFQAGDDLRARLAAAEAERDAQHESSGAIIQRMSDLIALREKQRDAAEAALAATTEALRTISTYGVSNDIDVAAIARTVLGACVEGRAT
jgi:hypothetical protein